MTDITDKDRRAARAWAKNWQGDQDDDTSAAARVILATVEAPATTLAEAMRTWAAATALNFGEEASFDPLIARAEQIEEDLAGQVEATEDQKRHTARIAAERDEARAEVECLTADLKVALDKVDHLTAGRNRIATGRYVTYAEVDGKPVQKGAESNAESIDPADVKPGEAWAANIWYGDEQYSGIAIKSAGGDWNVCRDEGTHSTYRMNEYVELIARLVPAPRVITNPDELEKLAPTSIIRDGRGWPGGVTDQGVIMINGFCVSDEEVLSHGPVTVLWEPEA